MSYALTSLAMSSNSWWFSSLLTGAAGGGDLDQFSISSMVCGRGLFKVSGRSKASRPTAMDIVPNNIPGNQGMLRAWNYNRILFHWITWCDEHSVALISKYVHLMSATTLIIVSNTSSIGHKQCALWWWFDEALIYCIFIATFERSNNCIIKYHSMHNKVFVI